MQPDLVSGPDIRTHILTLDKFYIKAQYRMIPWAKELATPKPRFTQITLEATSYCHCVSRCVRSAFLCGGDQLTGKNYNYRGQWIEDKLYELITLGKPPAMPGRLT